MPTKSSPILLAKNTEKAGTIATRMVERIVEAARSLKEAALPIAQDLFALRILFADATGTPDAYGTSGAYKAYVREHVWEPYERELQLKGLQDVVNVSSFKETVQNTCRLNTEAWIAASDDLTDTQRDAIRIANDTRKATRDANAKKPKTRSVVSEVRKASNTALSASTKSKTNPSGTPDYAGLLGAATEMVGMVHAAVVRKTDHGITPKQAATLKKQVVALAASVRQVGNTLDGITRSATKKAAPKKDAAVKVA